MPRPSPPSVGAEAPRAAEPTAPADRNVAVGSHAQYVPSPTLTAARYCRGDLDLLTLKVVSESRVTWATLCANFSLPRPLCSRLRPDVRDRQTD